MDRYLKQRLCDAPAVVHGGVYTFRNASGYEGICVIVAAKHRALDKYVSAISLIKSDVDFSYYDDVIKIVLPDGEQWSCHCGMITYMRRDRIGEKITELSVKQMKAIKDIIAEELDMSSDDSRNYKQMYYDLINKVANWDKDQKPSKKKAIRKTE